MKRWKWKRERERIWKEREDKFWIMVKGSTKLMACFASFKNTYLRRNDGKFVSLFFPSRSIHLYTLG